VIDAEIKRTGSVDPKDWSDDARTLIGVAARPTSPQQIRERALTIAQQDPQFNYYAPEKKNQILQDIEQYIQSGNVGTQQPTPDGAGGPQGPQGAAPSGPTNPLAPGVIPSSDASLPANLRGAGIDAPPPPPRPATPPGPVLPVPEGDLPPNLRGAGIGQSAPAAPAQPQAGPAQQPQAGPKDPPPDPRALGYWRLWIKTHAPIPAWKWAQLPIAIKQWLEAEGVAHQ
jgi:hypothetical protein